MIDKHEHELHRRRKGRNWALGAVLGGFVVLIFAITIAKLADGQMIQGF